MTIAAGAGISFEEFKSTLASMLKAIGSIEGRENKALLTTDLYRFLLERGINHFDDKRCEGFREATINKAIQLKNDSNFCPDHLRKAINKLLLALNHLPTIMEQRAREHMS
jgi:hypothetical protein